MSTEKPVRLPSTDEINALAGAQFGVEHLAGTVLLERYRLIEILGSGGAAVVYRAEHTLMHKVVAVKILRPELAQRADFVQRFLSEARTVARLRHENIVDIVDVGRTETGLVFCVMEYLEGEELGRTLEHVGRMPWRRARDIVLQVCHALAAAHAAGVVHRDVKPQNCFRIRHGKNDDFMKLLDFGISKQLDNDQGLTATGMIIGTAEYMSPEQARGRHVDARTDIYAVGAMLFELLGGRPPFEGDTFLDVLVKQASDPIPKISSLVAGLDRGVDELLARALAKNPEDRFQTVQELMAALSRIAEDTFVGLLRSPGITAMTDRPESVLGARSTGRHAAAAAGIRSSRIGVAAAVVVVALGVGFGVWKIVSDQAGDESDATTPVVATAEELPESDLPSDVRTAPEPPVQPEQPPVEPPVALPPPAEDADEEPLILVPDSSPPDPTVDPPDPESDQEPSAQTPTKKPAKLSGPIRPAGPPSKPVTVSSQSKKRLENRISNLCKSLISPEDVVVVVVGDSGLSFKQGERVYPPLSRCIREKVVADNLEHGTYRMQFRSSASPTKPKTIEPFGD